MSVGSLVYQAEMTEGLTRYQIYYAANRTAIREAQKKSYQANAVERIEAQKQYTEANKEKVRAYQAKYRLKKANARVAV